MAEAKSADGARTDDPRSGIEGALRRGRSSRLPGPWAGVHTISVQQIGPPVRTGMFQLPPDIDDFTGRDDDLRDLQDTLGASDERAAAVVVSAIAGRAGVGKTALATRVAHRLRPSFPDGQLYVNLRGTEVQRLKPTDVLGDFLLELGVSRAAIPERLEQRAARYRAQLVHRRVLVVLDNAAEEAQVRPLLPGTPGSAALITSRARLEELELTRSIVLDVLDHDQAVELLANVVGPDRVAAEPTAVRTIVELCGYLPLAIRIAGAKLAASWRMPLAMLAERLAGEHGRLAELRLRDLEVRASFALNYQNLNEEQRHIFRLLGLLRSPDFSGWVAAALLDSELSDGETLIARLVEAQVLEVAHKTSTGNVRYRFHDLLRVFARERLWAEEPSEAQEAALHRALHSYLGLARHAARLLDPGGLGKLRDLPWPAARLADVVDQIASDPAAWFEGERMSLISTVEQASDDDLQELTWELARSLAYFFKLRTHWSDWQHTQRLALRAARRARDRLATASAFQSLGDAYIQLGRFNKAAAQFEQALTLSDALGDRRGAAWAHVGLSDAERERGSADAAADHCEQARLLFQELDDHHGEGWALEGLALLHRIQGRYDEAVSCFEQGLHFMREVGDRRGEAYCLMNLGLVQRDRGRFESALQWSEQAQPIFEELADRHGETFVLLNKGHVHREEGRLDEALRCLIVCLPAFQQMGEHTGEAWTWLNLGMVHQAQGDLGKAAAELGNGRSIFERLGHPRGAAWASMGFGELYRGQGHIDTAVASFERAVPTLREISDRLGLAKALHGYGDALAARGDGESASAAWEEAAAIFRQLGAFRTPGYPSLARRESELQG